MTEPNLMPVATVIEFLIDSCCCESDYNCQYCEAAASVRALEARVTAAEELRDLTMKDRDEFRERAIAAEQRNAALEAQIATLREELSEARGIAKRIIHELTGQGSECKS